MNGRHCWAGEVDTKNAEVGECVPGSCFVLRDGLRYCPPLSEPCPWDLADGCHYGDIEGPVVYVVVAERSEAPAERGTKRTPRFP